MCGISGIYHFKNQEAVDEQLLIQMRDILAHRGPDDQGHFIDGCVGLAHRRLSIIDLSAGHQPMFNEDRSVAVVYNGEIYNFQDIRQDLIKKGHQFQTRSDTEVIIHAYEEYGTQCVDLFRGMFAFALWDNRQQRLFLVRDRMGIKPLYYTVLNNNTILFASEIKSILLHPGVNREVDQNALNLYMTLRYVPGPLTMFKNIFKLMPGHTMTVGHQGIRSEKYWDLDFSESNGLSDGAYGERFLAILEEAIRLRLISDVPLGVFLSGGVDSSTVVALMSEIAGGTIQTFSVGYDDDGGENEFEQAQLVASRFGTNHHEFRLKAGDFMEFIPKLIWHLDEPVADSSTIPLYFISKLARQHVTVILSGEGADELLAGYYIYKKMLQIDGMRRTPLPHLLRFFGPLLTRVVRNQKIQKYMTHLARPLEGSYFGISSVFSDMSKDQLFVNGQLPTPAISPGAHLASFYERSRGWDTLSRMLYLDSKVWLPDDLLMKADKMTMATSMELRVPFLDHKLVECAASLPSALKLKGRETKYLLKHIMNGRLPDSVLYGKKKGFPVPIRKWFREAPRGFLEDILLGKSTVCARFFNTRFVRQIITDHQSGRGDYSDHIWTLIVFEYWHRMFIDQDVSGGPYA